MEEAMELLLQVLQRLRIRDPATDLFPAPAIEVRSGRTSGPITVNVSSSHRCARSPPPGEVETRKSS
jgi:hypothetical protein